MNTQLTPLQVAELIKDSVLFKTTAISLWSVYSSIEIMFDESEHYSVYTSDEFIQAVYSILYNESVIEVATEAAPVATMTIEDVARVCHEMNMALCLAAGDHSQLPWEEAADNIRQSAIDGVCFHLNNPHAAPSSSHDAWMAGKIADGYVYGPVKDNIAKTHPSLVPYEELSFVEKAKDYVFKQSVESLRKFVDSKYHI